ncbi:caspase-7-like [Conger conger]|uniref:caspase-7-like n=1 Tax=Conger conger TaxID=82655 RepID=UPI002A59ACF2|nr:caspase-7-like [Conger conger]
MEVDRMLGQRTFKSLKFTVQVENDLSADDMLKALQRVSEEDHTDMACFVCMLLSHGENGTLWGTDRQVPLRSLTSVLSAKRCPSLEGKPKLFFIQACRGREYDPGVETVETDSVTHTFVAKLIKSDRRDFVLNGKFLVK